MDRGSFMAAPVKFLPATAGSRLSIFFATLTFLTAALSGLQGRAQTPSSQLFTLLHSDQTNITFENKLVDTKAHNIFFYENYYSGGGTASAILTGMAWPTFIYR